MQEQNFEKQVKQKMEEFSVTPSSPVWNKVEEQIRQKRNRRRVFFWLFPLGLLLAGLVTWSVMQSNDKPLTDQIKNLAENHPVNNNRPRNLNNGITNDQTKPDQQERSTQANTPETQQQKDGNEKTAEGVSVFAYPQKISVAVSNLKKTGNKNTRHAVVSVKDKSFVTGNTVAENKKTGIDIPPAIVNATLPKSDSVVTNTTVTTIASSPTETQSVKHEENNIAEIIKHGELNKWKISPYFSMGISSLQYAIGSQNKTTNRFSTSPNPSNPSFGSGGVTTSQTLSSPTNGMSLDLGIALSKRLNKRFEFSTGLGYYYASTHLRVGESVNADSMFVNNFTPPVRVDQYYRTGNTTKYTNSFHFIEIPVTINWRVNKKIPLELGMGISVSQLIATNALTYDAGSGNYYENKKIFYKTHCAFGSSLNYRLFQIKNKSFYAGPYFKYHLTQLEKNNSRHYLFSAGLGLKLKF